MKRVNRLLVLSIVMVMSLSACSSKESQVQDEQPAETEVVTEEPNKVDEVETPSEEETKEVDSKDEASADGEKEALKTELKEKYDITEPGSFVRGDATGKWRIVKVANSTPPTEYAVNYAKAYMNDGDIHYVVNFSLNTTTMFNRYSNGTTSVIEAKTTEYVDKEEHDASIIGEGLLLTDKILWLLQLRKR